MELIELRNIYKTYQIGDIAVPLLKGISLTIAREEMVALIWICSDSEIAGHNADGAG